MIFFKKILEVAKKKNNKGTSERFQKSFSLSLKKEDKTKFLYEALENANIFKKLYSKTAEDLREKLSKAHKNYHAQTSCNVSNDFELISAFQEVVKKTLISLDTSKTTGLDEN